MKLLVVLLFHIIYPKLSTWKRSAQRHRLSDIPLRLDLGPFFDGFHTWRSDCTGHSVLSQKNAVQVHCCLFLCLGFYQQNVLKAMFQGMTGLPLEVSPLVDVTFLEQEAYFIASSGMWTSSSLRQHTEPFWKVSLTTLPFNTFHVLQAVLFFWKYFTCWPKIETSFFSYILKIRKHVLVVFCPRAHIMGPLSLEVGMTDLRLVIF